MTPGRGWLRAACAAGLLHALPSLYWAAGGRWLLDTVGPWALDLAEERPGRAVVLLLVVAAAKVAGALVPLGVETGRVPGRAVWRPLSWAGAAVLLVWGGANTVVAWLVLGGVLDVAGPTDRAALLGHAALWDPLFVVWGLCLAVGLWRTRRSTAPSRR